MLMSSLFAPSSDLAGVAAGARRILAPEVSDSVALVQQALLAVGGNLATTGVDGIFGPQTGAEVSRFKSDRGLSPSDPVVGPGTTKRLDQELAYLEGISPDPQSLDAKALIRDPLQAGVLERQLADPGIGQKVLDLAGFGDRLCFRISLLLGSQIAAKVGRFIEPFVFKDFQALRAPSTPAIDFFDSTGSSTPYVEFLLVQHPAIDPIRIGELGQARRPDILSNRVPQEWYEIKPQSFSGASEAWLKFNSIPRDYAARGLPYKPGVAYTPSPEVFISDFLADGGENLTLVLNLVRAAPGLIFWSLCVKGDYVAYFNRARLAAGILGLLVALGILVLPAAEAAAFAAAIAEIAAQFGVVLLPALVPR